MDAETRIGIRELWGIAWIAAHFTGILPSWVGSGTVRKHVPPGHDRWALPNPTIEDLYVVHATPTEPFFIMPPDIVVEMKKRTIAIDIGSAMDGVYSVGIGTAILYTATEGILLYWAAKEPYVV